MLIRKSNLSDAATIAAFNQAMAQETEHKILPNEIILNGVKNLMTQPQFGFYVVAETENEIVGSLMITYEWSDWRNGIIWWLQSVFVKKEFRQQGVFAALLKFVEAEAKKENAVGIRLYMEKKNHNAAKTYLQCGFKQTDYLLFEKIMANKI